MNAEQLLQQQWMKKNLSSKAFSNILGRPILKRDVKRKPLKINCVISHTLNLKNKGREQKLEKCLIKKNASSNILRRNQQNNEETRRRLGLKMYKIRDSISFGHVTRIGQNQIGEDGMGNKITREKWQENLLQYGNRQNTSRKRGSYGAPS